MEHLQSRMDYAAKLFRTAEYEEAKIVFTSLLKIYIKQQATKEICLCLYRLSCIAYVRGEMQSFSELYTQYEELCASIDDLQTQVEYYVLRGLSQLGLQHYDQAISEFTHVVTLADGVSFIKQKVSAHLYIQKCHLLMSHYEVSLQLSDDIWSAYEAVITPDTGQLFHYLLNRADTMLALGELVEANTLIIQCEEHVDYMLMPVERLKTMVSRAKFHLAKQEPNIALVILQQAEQMAIEQEDRNLLSEIYETLVENYEMLDKTKEALACAKQRLKLHKELLKL